MGCSGIVHETTPLLFLTENTSGYVLFPTPYVNTLNVYMRGGGEGRKGEEEGREEGRRWSANLKCCTKFVNFTVVVHCFVNKFGQPPLYTLNFGQPIHTEEFSPRFRSSLSLNRERD